MCVLEGGCYLLSFPARGLATIWIAHVTFTLCFVTVVVSSRLQEMDLSLEEAAMDLGASRLTVFTRITLPIIAPALVAGWLLAFTLSLDDVVVASFVATPGSTTLPMKVFASVRMALTARFRWRRAATLTWNRMLGLPFPMDSGFPDLGRSSGL